MVKFKGVWGIDMGICSMKAIRLEMQDGKQVATHFDFIEHPKLLSQPDADKNQLVRETLLKFLQRNKVKGDLVCLAVASASSIARFVKLPPVEESKIVDIVRFEAKQQIPFPLLEVVWDFQKLGTGMVVDGLALDTEVGLFAMKRDFINETLNQYRNLNIELDLVQMSPLSLINFLAYDVLGQDFKADGSPAKEDDGPKKCILGLDIGADMSNLVLTDGGRIIEQRTISIGGSRFTKEISKEFKLTFPKAEHLKRTVNKTASKDGPDLKEVVTAVKPVMQDFVGELQRSLTYFTNRHRNSEIEYMVALGNGFKLPGLQRFLQEKLGLELRKPTKFNRLSGDSVVKANNFTDNLGSFAVAYGLGIQGLKLARMVTNLLPPDMASDRELKAKRPWAVAAAAAILVGLSTYSLKNHLQARAYVNEEVKKSIGSADRVFSQVGAGKKAFEVAKDKVAKEKANLESLLSGQGERFNWLEFYAFLNEALPRPDGNNLDKRQRSTYWEALQGKPRGESAYNFLRLRQSMDRDREGRDGNELGDPLGVGIDQLVEVNITGVNCRYTGALETFWQQVKTGGSTGERRVKEDVRPLEHWEKAPSGAGWVVELRGYTFHQDKKKFLVEVLLENLARYGIVAGRPAGQPMPMGENPPMGETPAGGLADMGPVVNRVTHAVVFQNLSKRTSDRNNFELIEQSHLGSAMRVSGGFGEGAMFGGGGGGGGPLAGGSPAGPGGPGPGGPGGGEGGGGPAASPEAMRDAWQPLGRGGQVGGSFGGGPSGPGGPGGMPGGPGFSGPGGSSGPGSSGSASKSPHERTEFVVFFIWKEPTPSDSMRASAGAESAPPPPPTDGATGGGSPLTSTGEGKGTARGIIPPEKSFGTERPRGVGPGARPPIPGSGS